MEIKRDIYLNRLSHGDHLNAAIAAKTCSDGRVGMNLSSIIEKLMFYMSG